ncbi:MAG: hypothetical protein ACT4PE_04325 [Candidatus Eiseniibacteriota bacterium]
MSSTIASLAPTVARLFGAAPPGLAGEPPLAAVLDGRERVMRGEPIERCLVFCPDALGAGIWGRCPELAGSVTKHAGLCVLLSSVLPPRTPVCFASMFTGGQPEQHGIRTYERPVLTCDTLFDALARVGRRTAIVAVERSSIDLIFRGRDIDYWSERYDAEVLERAITVVGDDRHDLVVVYQQEYDDRLHETEPFSEACLRAVERHVGAFVTLAETVSRAWRRHHRAVVFAPDHGAHFDPQTGRGDHGLDIAEDMEVSHWYGLSAGERK